PACRAAPSARSRTRALRAGSASSRCDGRAGSRARSASGGRTRCASSSPARSRKTPKRSPHSPATAWSRSGTAPSRYHPPRRDRVHRHAPHPALDHPRAPRPAAHARAARAHPERPLPAPALPAPHEGAAVQALAGEGLAGGDRADEPRARERAAQARAAPEAPPRPAAGAEGDVPPHAPGTRRAARDAGAAGLRPGGGDEPPDAPPAREAKKTALRRRLSPRLSRSPSPLPGARRRRPPRRETSIQYGGAEDRALPRRSSFSSPAKRQLRGRLDSVSNPDVGLDVVAAAVLEVHRHEGAGDDVVAVLGEVQPRPLLPVGARGDDRHRARRAGEKLAAKALVRP